MAPRARSAARRLEQSSTVFAALGDPTRLRLVKRLGDDGPLSVSELANDEPVSRQAVTKHLRVLEDAGLAVSRKHGRQSMWALRPDALDDIRYWLDEVSSQWDSAIDRLRALVEDDAD